MTLRSYLIIMIIATLLCWTAFSFVLWTVNPEATNWIGFLLFYLSLFLALTGLAALIGFLIRFAPHLLGGIIPKCFRGAKIELHPKGAGFVALRHELVFNSVKNAFRQSFFFAFLITAVLFLLSNSLFTWVNLGLLVVGLSVLEFFMISCNSRNM